MPHPATPTTGKVSQGYTMRTIQEVQNLDARLTAIRRQAADRGIETGTLRPLQLLSLFCRWFLGSDSISADRFTSLAKSDLDDAIIRRRAERELENEIGEEMVDVFEPLVDEATGGDL
jgi:hypothetical protein